MVVNQVRSGPLRRLPVQERSAARVERMLDVCAALVDELGYEALTTTLVAERAGVAIGSVYQFFPDKRALVQAHPHVGARRVGRLVVEQHRGAVEQSRGLQPLLEVQEQLLGGRRAGPEAGQVVHGLHVVVAQSLDVHVTDAKQRPAVRLQRQLRRLRGRVDARLRGLPLCARVALRAQGREGGGLGRRPGAVAEAAARRQAPTVAQRALRLVRTRAQEYGVKNLEVRIKGPGPGRESAVRALNALGFKIGSISDVTPVPHNGCRPPKRRRV